MNKFLTLGNARNTRWWLWWRSQRISNTISTWGGAINYDGDDDNDVDDDDDDDDYDDDDDDEV